MQLQTAIFFYRNLGQLGKLDTCLSHLFQFMVGLTGNERTDALAKPGLKCDQTQKNTCYERNVSMNKMLMKHRPAKNDYQPWKYINKALYSDYARDTTCTVYTCIQAITITAMLKLNGTKHAKNTLHRSPLLEHQRTCLWPVFTSMQRKTRWRY